MADTGFTFKETLMRIFHAGAIFSVEITDAALESLQGFEQEHSNLVACYTQMLTLLKRLGDTGRLSTGFRNEWDGIWAVKARCGLRAYGSYFKGRRFVVAYVEYKKRDSVSQQLRDAINAAFEELN